MTTAGVRAQKHFRAKAQSATAFLKDFVGVFAPLREKYFHRQTLVYRLRVPSFQFNFEEYEQMKTKTSSISRPVTELEYSPTGISDGVHGELHAAPAYGDLAHGPHGTFIKMPVGYVSPTHTHTEDYWAVVVSGVMVNKKPDSPDVPLPAGSYFFQQGGEPHVTKCISADGCIFFVSQNGKFDYRE